MFKVVAFAPREAQCECGEALLVEGRFWGTQDHPWRQPKVECDCGKLHPLVGLPCPSDEGAAAVGVEKLSS